MIGPTVFIMPRKLAIAKIVEEEELVVAGPPAIEAVVKFSRPLPKHQQARW